jgi:DNA repair protein RadD
MIKQLRPYQQDALNNLRVRLKQVTHPLLVNASVGAGKSLIIAELLKIIERANWRALCLTMNSTLIQQNSETYIEQGGNSGIYCDGLHKKQFKQNVIYASPHSIVQGIKKGHPISNVKFNLIVIDECHNINPGDRNSMYMRILNHYGLMAQTEQYSYRIVGLTGTPYRGKGISIVGDDQFFKEEVCSISTSWLIENNYLTKPTFEKPHVESFDMNNLSIDKMGKFKHKELQACIDKKERLTAKIMQEIISFVEGGRQGAFIFASTVKHAKECMDNLPDNLSACITATTSHDDRKEILQKAKAGEIKYLVNVATLLVGVDVPNFDVCAWLRPTESLTLYTQGIGRVLRLSPGKECAYILDYAGNLERHGDIDDPIINEALKPKKKEDPDYCIPCHICGTKNKVTARRCIGLPNNKRCDYYFIFKPCKKCNCENDITARNCRSCDTELINPNAKLRMTKDQTIELDVKQAKYWISDHGLTNTPIIHVMYQTQQINVFENFYTTNDQARMILYAKFVKLHVEHPSEYFMHLNKMNVIHKIVYKEKLKTPYKIKCKLNRNNKLTVVQKYFNDNIL